MFCCSRLLKLLLFYHLFLKEIVSDFFQNLVLFFLMLFLFLLEEDCILSGIFESFYMLVLGVCFILYYWICYMRLRGRFVELEWIFHRLFLIWRHSSKGFVFFEIHLLFYFALNLLVMLLFLIINFFLFCHQEENCFALH